MDLLAWLSPDTTRSVTPPPRATAEDMKNPGIYRHVSCQTLKKPVRMEPGCPGIGTQYKSEKVQPLVQRVSTARSMSPQKASCFGQRSQLTSHHGNLPAQTFVPSRPTDSAYASAAQPVARSYCNSPYLLHDLYHFHPQVRQETMGFPDMIKKPESPPPTEPGSSEVATTSPSASDHSDVDSLAPRSIASPSISDAEKAHSTPPSSGSSSPANQEKIPLGNCVNDASDDSDAPVSARLLRKGPKTEAFASLVQGPSQKVSRDDNGISRTQAAAKPVSTPIARARSCQVRARDMNGCLDGELRSLEDEMADLTRDLVQLKMSLSKARPEIIDTENGRGGLSGQTST